jgi:four helix bundle protein
VGVRRFEDLFAWQLAYELQQQVFAFTANPPAVRDFKFCDQIRESSRSAPRNTAEGFGRYYPKEFIRFLRIAAGSLHETKNQLHEAFDRRYLTESDHDRLVQLTVRAIAANARLTRYLLSATPPNPRSTEPDKQR